MERTHKSLQEALEANLKAQSQVEKELILFAEKKKLNREAAAKIIRLLPSNSMLDNYFASCVDRPWSRRFFVDQTGSTAPPNKDSIFRKTLEKDMFFSHESPLWSTKEVEVLHQIVKENKAAVTPGNPGIEDIPVDFDDVALKLSSRFSTRRSAEECRVKYQPNRSSITKEEYLKLLKQFHSGEALSLDKRSRWQAFSAFRSFHGRNGSACPPWTLEEDEVLLRAIAAAGPQQVLDQSFSSKISPVLKKAPKMILQRTMNSLLNPKFLNDTWSDHDERKLCLLMKIYRDCPSPLCNISVSM